MTESLNVGAGRGGQGEDRGGGPVAKHSKSEGRITSSGWRRRRREQLVAGGVLAAVSIGGEGEGGGWWR